MISAIRAAGGIAIQVTMILAFWQGGEKLIGLVGLPIPGAVLGLLALWLLLTTGVLKVTTFKRGSQWLLAEMLLFFVPAVLVLLDHGELIGWLGVKIVLVIVMSTIVVMTTTAISMDLAHRVILRARRQADVLG